MLGDGSEMVANYLLSESELEGDHSGNFDAEFVMRSLPERWFQYFGRPAVIRVDPEGAFCASWFRDWAQSQGI